MSKGISWHQLSMLKQLLQFEKDDGGQLPVAWRALDYGPPQSDHTAPKGRWNIEQATRRALRNLEKRGLVDLGRYVFFPEAEPRRSDKDRTIDAIIQWVPVQPNRHVPGQSRKMTGVLLTDEGRRLATELTRNKS